MGMLIIRRNQGKGKGRFMILPQYGATLDRYWEACSSSWNQGHRVEFWEHRNGAWYLSRLSVASKQRTRKQWVREAYRNLLS